MKNINKLETMITEWLKPLPRIPAKWTKMIAENLWWITGISIVLSVIAIFMSISAINTAVVFLGRASSFLDYYSNSFYDSWWVAAAVVSMVMLIVNVVLMGKAFNPLKAMQKKGWDLLFIMFLIMVVARVIGLVLSFSVDNLLVGLVMALVGIAVGVYVLFEIRSNFKDGKIAAVGKK